MKSRITVNLTAEGEFEIWLNEQGRDFLLQELQKLSVRNDHFHLGADKGSEVELSSYPYRPGDRVLTYGKVLFRTDQWDKQYFPHVLADTK